MLINFINGVLSMLYKSVKIKIRNGIHLRIAAEIVQKADLINSKYGVSLYMKKPATYEPIAISMLALVSLKVKEGDIVEVCCKDESESGRKAVDELCGFILSRGMDDDNSYDIIDDILEESTIANEQIVESIPVGIIVIDINCSITTVNSYGLKIVDMTIKDVLGKNVRDIIPNSELPEVLLTNKPQLGKIQYINNHTLMVNRSPIFLNNKVIGAVGVFQDISEMVGMQELNEKLKKILEASHDLICFIDENRKVSYINPAYEKYFNISGNDLAGLDLKDVSPHGLRMKVFKSKEKIEDFLYQKDDLDIVTTIEPIFIEDSFKGVISISKPLSEMKQLMKKLEQSEEELDYYKHELKRYSSLEGYFPNIIGASGSLKESLLIAEKASKTTSTVLIRGESGTGKELIAKAIYNNSDRKDKPFIRVNCAAIPENLLESELFGYEKGAFTGAIKSKPGKFDMADHGTIFLDEIGDLPKPMQVKLLRVLQEREFERIGGLETHTVDVRIIAATNRELEEMLGSGEFREDLYYRLNVISIALPPLRNRKDDISLLTEHFINKLGNKLNKEVKDIEKECIEYLQQYSWPGNVRELENVIERAINMCDGSRITKKDLPLYITNTISSVGSLINLVNGELAPMEEYEKQIIEMAIKKYGSYNQAGKALGLTHRTVSLKCKKWGIKTE